MNSRIDAFVCCNAWLAGAKSYLRRMREAASKVRSTVCTVVGDGMWERRI
jgi:hypothetical protein